jgi:hypothetical protein
MISLDDSLARRPRTLTLEAFGLGGTPMDDADTEAHSGVGT